MPVGMLLEFHSRVQLYKKAETSSNKSSRRRPGPASGTTSSSAGLPTPVPFPYRIISRCFMVVVHSIPCSL